MGGFDAAAPIELWLDGDEAFEFRGFVTLAADGAFGPVLLPAGVHEVKLPPGTTLPIPEIGIETESLSDLVDKALVTAVIGMAMTDAAATKVSLTVAPGEEHFIELP